jgi:hypothetical protein
MSFERLAMLRNVDLRLICIIRDKLSHIGRACQSA